MRNNTAKSLKKLAVQDTAHYMPARQAKNNIVGHPDVMLTPKEQQKAFTRRNYRAKKRAYAKLNHKQKRLFNQS